MATMSSADPISTAARGLSPRIRVSVPLARGEAAGESSGRSTLTSPDLPDGAGATCVELEPVELEPEGLPGAGEPPDSGAAPGRVEGCPDGACGVWAKAPAVRPAVTSSASTIAIGLICTSAPASEQWRCHAGAAR